MIDRTKLPFRKNTEGYFLDKNYNILARISKESILIFPGGGIEEDESPEQGIQRETLEETGARIKTLKLLNRVNLIWDKDWAKTEKQKKRYEIYQGDEMYFYLGEIERFENNKNDAEDQWKGKKLIPLKEVIEIIEKGRNFERYREIQLRLLKQIQKKSLIPVK